MIRVAIIGAAGHGFVLSDVVRQKKDFQLIGFFDSIISESLSAGLPAPILGSSDFLAELIEQFCIKGLFLGIGDNFARKKCMEAIHAAMPAIQFPSLIHPAASVASSAVLDEGVVVLAGAVVGPMAKVGVCGLLNTLSNLDHHGEMAPFSSLAPGAHTGGKVKIGELSAVCLGANVLHGKTIGRNSVVGAGALVTEDIPDDVLAYGIPAKIIRKRQLGEKYL